MISPRSSPRFLRRSITPTVGISSAPPPLPPRKSSPTLEQCSTNFQNLSVRNGNRNTEPALNEAQSVVDLSQRNSELTHIPKSNSMHEIFSIDFAPQTKEQVLELSSPETIYGIIDSRYNFCNIDTKSNSQKFQNAVSSNCANNSVKYNNIPNITCQSDQDQLYISKEPPYENIRFDLPPKNKPNPLTVKTNGSVSYENLNMDYIKKLVSEGYSRDAVIRALGITRNNIDMACDILHEFGTKHG